MITVHWFTPALCVLLGALAVKFGRWSVRIRRPSPSMQRYMAMRKRGMNHD